jgi:hypothetical protein
MQGDQYRHSKGGVRRTSPGIRQFRAVLVIWHAESAPLELGLQILYSSLYTRLSALEDILFESSFSGFGPGS